MNLDFFKVCEFTLPFTNRFWTYLNMSASFIPAATALPFTSCHKGQRALTFGVQPSH